MTIDVPRDRWNVSAGSGMARTPALDGDLVIKRQVVKSIPRYVVQRRAGPAQLRFDSEQAARDVVTAFAEREAVDVWYRTGRTCVVLARHRREPASSAA